MATLYETTNRARRIVILILLAVSIILGIDTFSKYLSSPANPFFQSPSYYIQPTGSVTPPVPVIKSIPISDESNPSFAVEGVFKSFPDTVLIYTIERPREKLNTVEDAMQTAETLGFTSEPVRQNDLFTWSNAAQTRSLQFNKEQQTWSMRTQYFQDVEALKEKQFGGAETYERQALSAASAMGFRDQGLQKGAVLVKAAKLGLDGLFTSPLTDTTADYASMDIFRRLTISVVKDESDLTDAQVEAGIPPNLLASVYTTDPRVGSLHMIGTNRLSEFKTDIYELDFVNYEYNYNYSVRRIITPAEAWEQVRQGKGSLTLDRKSVV